MIRIITYFLPLILLVSFGCSTNSNHSTEAMSFDQKILFENLATNLILPAYRNLAQKTNDLDVAIQAFVDNPSVSKLQEVRNKYIQAYLAWQEASFYEFGPAAGENLALSANTYPTNASKIEENIQSNTVPENTKTKGFPALDYLLYGIGNNESAIVEKYHTDTFSTNRKTYLRHILNDLKKRINTTLASWSGDYRESFISKEGNDAGSSLSLFVNGILLSYEADLKNAKFGVPAGVSVGLIEPNPQMVESLYAEKSKVLAQAKINAFIRLFKGDSGMGLDDYLMALKTKSSKGNDLSDEILNQLNDAKSKIDNLPEKPLHQIIENDKKSIEAIYYSLQQAVIYLKTDMTSALSVQVVYQDGDGD